MYYSHSKGNISHNRRGNCSEACVLVSFTVSLIVYWLLRGTSICECAEKKWFREFCKTEGNLQGLA